MAYIEINDAGPRSTPRRPRCKALLRVDLYNAYAQLGVSPLISTDEIKTAVLRQRKELMRQRRTRGAGGFDQVEDQITRLQAIEDQIGEPAARARYDQAHPLNELLTVQPSPQDRWFDPRRRAGLATAWLVEELGRESLLPSPECIAFWAPHGIDPALKVFLAGFTTGPATGPASQGAALPPLPTAAPADPARGILPEVGDLDALSGRGPAATPPADPSESDPHG